MTPRLPARPQPGQSIALAAPASRVPSAALKKGMEVFSALWPKLHLRMDDQVGACHYHFAGRDEDRAGHLQQLFSDPCVGAVLAARGGFGSSRLLGLLDIPALVAAAKLIIGFSDLTCLLNTLADRGLICIHGPVATQLPRLDYESRRELGGLLSGRTIYPSSLKGRMIIPGKAAGRLMGGNLTMLAHMVGTPWQPDFNGAILFLEDIGEAPYRLDRLMTQLELAGVLEQAAGFAIGSLWDHRPQPGGLIETLLRRLAPYGKPIISHLPVGHGRQNRSLPMGALAAIDSGQAALNLGLDLA